MTLTQQDRTEAVAHYIIARADPNKLGAVKLNKVMWFADLEAYRRLGRTVTGQASYEKRQHGPVPNNIVRSIRRLEQSDKIATREVPTFGGTRREHVWLQKPDLSTFSADEVDILNEAIDWVCELHTARSISELSHDKLWENAEIGEQIPVGAAVVVPDDLDGTDIAWALSAMDRASA
ncbi:Panacea domain-containing protein [Sphingomonas sp. BT-65]|uniref:Panacea domain-containing protein n=1 Tax=Sphingomonas sp. BT-65 TaxID=2989821 RepID=UPI00223584C5|nr:Panacea domain-containing protein [Sphingomonas sp. BT-65]MCW4462215.1 Panacea domain-containing protein [Sphingomonas sp. BT-65]